MKDREWLKRWMNSPIMGEEKFEKGYWKAVEKFNNLVGEMDEPETLSQEWIDEHLTDGHNAKAGDAVVFADDLKKLITNEPELHSEEWHELIYKQLKDYSALTDKSFDFYWNAIANDIDIDDLMNVARENEVIVAKPEIPRFVAEWIESIKPVKTLYVAFRFIHSRRHKSKEEKKIHQWLNKGNSEVFAKAWVHGYTVKEEPKYSVVVKGETQFGKSDVGVYLWKNVDGEICIGDNLKLYNPNKNRYQLTEQEIKDYDERYWAFRKPVDSYDE